MRSCSSSKPDLKRNAMPFDQNALDSLRIDRTRDSPQEPSRGIYRWFLAVMLILALVAAAYALLRDNAVEVRTAIAVANSSASATVLNASGYVTARRQATVSAKVTGKVAEVLIEEGMRVQAGQLLARLDDSSIQPLHTLAQRQLEAARKNLEEVKIRLGEARRNLNRMQQLRQDKLVSELQLDQAQSEAAALAARLNALESEVQVAAGTVQVREQDLDDLQVRAPFDGIVISKDAQPGEIVSPISAGGGFTRTGIATIVDMDSREIEVDVNEAFINRVRDEQRTQATLDAYPDWTIPSHVINIVPTADRQKATVRVRIGFDTLDPRILPDMGVKVSFLEAHKDSVGIPRFGVSVPAGAVIEDGDTRYVWRVHGNTVERVAVSSGEERDGQIEVLSGIQAGDVVVAQPGPELRDGAKVKY